MAGLQAEILTRYLLNTKQEYWPLDHDVRFYYVNLLGKNI